MSIYHKVTTDELSTCLDSLLAQTRLPDEFIIVKDGPLGDSLEQQLNDFYQHFPQRVRFIVLPTNKGLIAALNIGLAHCNGDWILRMDADDAAISDRVETQLNYIAAHPEVDILGSAMLEFDTDPNKPLRKKPVAVTHAAIKAQMPYRNPINHPTTCCRKSSLLAIGGYPDLKFLEDYFLWARLLHQGAIFHNLEQPLHLYRFDSGTLTRRAGLANFRNECWLRWWMFRQGMLNPATLILVVGLQLLLRLTPSAIRTILWRTSRTKIK
ncbi:MAG: glycosyltransferase [Pseudomonadales bacterium]|nr:glycosyltransferase [Pseudomonadales bacterium]